MDGIVNKNTHFVSFLGMDMLPWNAFIHSHASGKKPLMFEGQFRCRDVIGARAECDLATVYHLTKTLFLEVFSFWISLMFLINVKFGMGTDNSCHSFGVFLLIKVLQ